MKKGLIFLMGVLVFSSLVLSLESRENYLVKFKESDVGLFSVAGVDSNEAVLSSGAVEMNLSDSELEDLLESGAVEVFEPVRYDFHTMMVEVNSIVSLDESWGLETSNLNLTGLYQTACVIDTGIDFTHPDLVGKNLTCNLNCTGASCVEDCGTTDLNGHGTHVAGIIAANGSIKGVAPDANLIGLKVFQGSSSDVSSTIWITNAIDWCVDNSETYNISVISLSLGSSTLYSNYCDASFPASFTPSINSAYAKNISVVVSSGNEANYTHIASPACIQNAIPVGDTYDANIGGVSWGNPIICSDLTTALDKIVCHANRNSLVQLLAPGAMINSTYLSGGYDEKGGTSMATPVVSGSFLVIKEFLNLTGRTKTPLEIESVLNDSGVTLSDLESGEDYSRINLYDALLSLDNIEPNVSLISPDDSVTNSSQNQSFSCNATDWQLANVTFYLWNSSGVYYNESVDLTGTENSSEFNLTDISRGSYEWNCEVYDMEGNVAFATSNNSLTIGGVGVDLISPEDLTYTQTNETSFNCSCSSDVEYELSNLTFYLWNSSGILIYNESVDVLGVSNSSVFSYNLTLEDSYEWNCKAINNASNFSLAVNNYTVTFDITDPVVSDLSEGSVTTSSAVISWTSDEATNFTSTLGSSNSTYSTSHSFTKSGLSASTTYNYNVTSCDRAGNCVNTSGSFTTGDEDDDDSGGGGGGGGGSPTKKASTETTQLSERVSKTLSKGESFNFTLRNQNHSLEVLRVGNSSANIIVRSDPIELVLEVGKVEKLNLTSAEFYDFYVRLDSVEGGEAKFTLDSIWERISELSDYEKSENYTTSQEDVEGEKNYFGAGLILLGILAILWVGVWISEKQKESKDKKEGKSKEKHGKRRSK